MVKRKQLASTPIPDNMRNNWTTPQFMWHYISTNWNIICDVAASLENHLCKLFFTKEINALNQDWIKLMGAMDGEPPRYVYGNPPYDDLDSWFAKFARESGRGNLGVVALVPAYAGEKRWHRYVWGKASRIIFPTGRLSYGHPITGENKKTANFGSVIIVWEPYHRLPVGRTICEPLFI